MTTDPVDQDGRAMRERMLAGDLYRGADEELVAEMNRGTPSRWRPSATGSTRRS